MRSVAMLSVLALLAGCSGSAEAWTGGPVTPSMVPVHVEASPRPITEALDTGIRVGGSSLVLYLCCYEDYLDVYADWTPARPAVYDTGGWAAVRAPFFGVFQRSLGDGTVVEYGGVRADAVTEVTVESAGGVRTPARFAAWPGHAELTVFWVVRQDAPIPENVPSGEGLWVPLAPERYPLITARGPGGAVLGSMRLRPTAVEQKSG